MLGAGGLDGDGLDGGRLAWAAVFAAAEAATTVADPPTDLEAAASMAVR